MKMMLSRDYDNDDLFVFQPVGVVMEGESRDRKKIRICKRDFSKRKRTRLAALSAFSNALSSSSSSKSISSSVDSKSSSKTSSISAGEKEPGVGVEGKSSGSARECWHIRVKRWKMRNRLKF